MTLSTAFPVTTIVVAMIISIPPMISCIVIDCLKNATLKMTAVTGSRAPKIAVGVDPIICIAADVQAKDKTVGIIANAIRLYQPVCLSGSVNSVPIAILKRNIVLPNISTKKSSFEVGILDMALDPLTSTIYMA